MITQKLKNLIGNTDIYLLDQLLKGRITESSKVLDAGCGGGRNLHLLIENNIDFTAFDPNENRILDLVKRHPNSKDFFQVATLENFKSIEKFDFIICNAVLHFAESHVHFESMFSSLVKLLAKSGVLFIRMTSDIGIENKVQEIKNGTYSIPDGSIRYLLTRLKMNEMIQKYDLEFIEPLKTVNVNDMRCMSTLVLRKT